MSSLVSNFKNLREDQVLNISKIPNGKEFIEKLNKNSKYFNIKGRKIVSNNTLSPRTLLQHIENDTEIFPDKCRTHQDWERYYMELFLDKFMKKVST